jgi:putative acetyltransferase
LQQKLSGHNSLCDAAILDKDKREMIEITIRKATAEDFDATARLFFESVRRGTARHYSEDQRKAWAPDVPSPEDWRERLGAMDTWIAETGGKIVGFMSLMKSGHLDLAFVHPDWIGKGVAFRLYETLEAHARATGLTQLNSDASLLARPFFERQGWRVIQEQRPVRNGVELVNFRMEKNLGC